MLNSPWFLLTAAFVLFSRYFFTSDLYKSLLILIRLSLYRGQVANKKSSQLFILQLFWRFWQLLPDFLYGMFKPTRSKLHLIAGRPMVPSVNLSPIRHSILLVYGSTYGPMSIVYFYHRSTGISFRIHWLISACVCFVIFIGIVILVSLRWNKLTGFHCSVSWKFSSL